MKTECIVIAASAVLACLAALPVTGANLPGKLSEDGKTLWIDGADLPLEGRGFPDSENLYQRMPDRLKAMTNVNIGVWLQGKCSAGMLFRFNINKSQFLKVRWSLSLEKLAGSNMGPLVKSGIDLYMWDSRRRQWRFGGVAGPKQKDGNVKTFGVPNPCDVMLYLPCYNGTTSFEIGVSPDAVIKPVKRRVYGIDKPIVFYGTSITQGGCVSRPGLAYPAVVSRHFDAPHVNLGFSGNGRMEMEMADMLLEIDASCYVLDSLWNMKYGEVEARFEPFLRKLKAAKPNVPIVTLEMCVPDNRPSKSSLFARGVVEKLKKEDPKKWANLRHIRTERLYFDDGEGTVDRCHPNEWGMMKIANEIKQEAGILLNIPQAK